MKLKLIIAAVDAVIKRRGISLVKIAARAAEMVEMSKSQDKSIIKFALPVGSLNDTTRGNTSQLLADAGFEVEGYKPGKESIKPQFVNDSQIRAFVDRPQNMPVALANGVYDAAILGDDWALEWRLAGVNITQVEDLQYGKVRIVFAVKETSPVGSIEQLVKSSRRQIRRSGICIRTEYLLIAKKAIDDTIETLSENRYDTGFSSPDLITRRDMRVAKKSRMRIEESFGKTEISAINGSTIDCIVESTQTGKSLREAGLKEIGTVYTSRAGLYASPLALETPEKRRKIEQTACLLRGAVRARSFEYVSFNVGKGKLPSVVAYLRENGYTAKVPTVSIYAGNAVVSTLLPKMSYPKIVAELQQLGADDIVRLPARQIISAR